MGISESRHLAIRVAMPRWGLTQKLKPDDENDIVASVGSRSDSYNNVRWLTEPVNRSRSGLPAL